MADIKTECYQVVTIGYIKTFLPNIQKSDGTQYELPSKYSNDTYCPTYYELTGGTIIPTRVVSDFPKDDVDGIKINSTHYGTSNPYTDNQLVDRKDLIVEWTRYSATTIGANKTVMEGCGDSATTTYSSSYRRFTNSMTTNCTTATSETTTSVTNDNNTCHVITSSPAYGSVGACTSYTYTIDANGSESTRNDTIIGHTTFRGTTHNSTNSIVMTQSGQCCNCGNINTDETYFDPIEYSGISSTTTSIGHWQLENNASCTSAPTISANTSTPLPAGVTIRTVVDGQNPLSGRFVTDYFPANESYVDFRTYEIDFYYGSTKCGTYELIQNAEKYNCDCEHLSGFVTTLKKTYSKDSNPYIIASGSTKCGWIKGNVANSDMFINGEVYNYSAITSDDEYEFVISGTTTNNNRYDKTVGLAFNLYDKYGHRVGGDCDSVTKLCQSGNLGGGGEVICSPSDEPSFCFLPVSGYEYSSRLYQHVDEPSGSLIENFAKIVVQSNGGDVSKIAVYVDYDESKVEVTNYGHKHWFRYTNYGRYEYFTLKENIWDGNDLEVNFTITTHVDCVFDANYNVISSYPVSSYSKTIILTQNCGECIKTNCYNNSLSLYFDSGVGVEEILFDEINNLFVCPNENNYTYQWSSEEPWISYTKIEDGLVFTVSENFDNYDRSVDLKVYNGSEICFTTIEVTQFRHHESTDICTSCESIENNGISQGEYTIDIDCDECENGIEISPFYLRGTCSSGHLKVYYVSGDTPSIRRSEDYSATTFVCDCNSGNTTWNLLFKAVIIKDGTEDEPLFDNCEVSGNVQVNPCSVICSIYKFDPNFSGCSESSYISGSGERLIATLDAIPSGDKYSCLTYEVESNNPGACTVRTEIDSNNSNKVNVIADIKQVNEPANVIININYKNNDMQAEVYTYEIQFRILTE